MGVWDVAQALGVDERTVRRWCESGKLPAIAKPFGRKVTYEISPEAVDMFRQRQSERQAKTNKSKDAGKPHSEMLAKWEAAMAKGVLTGKPYSQRTILDYLYHTNLFFKHYKAVSASALKASLMRIPSQMFVKREHHYKAVICLGKFLISQGCLDAGFLDEVKPLCPKRHIPPKRHTVTESQVVALVDACQNAYDRCLVVLLSQTGLRAGEFCALTMQDIDTTERVLLVRLGKGGKARKVGLSTQALASLQTYLEEAGPLLKSGHLFRDINGKPLTPRGLHARLERIGKKAKVLVSPHGLRRAFVTINANKGRPLQMLQKACGHSDIKTTMGYCMTSENEVIEAMKQWN